MTFRSALSSILSALRGLSHEERLVDRISQVKSRDSIASQVRYHNGLYGYDPDLGRQEARRYQGDVHDIVVESVGGRAIEEQYRGVQFVSGFLDFMFGDGACLGLACHDGSSRCWRFRNGQWEAIPSDDHSRKAASRIRAQRSAT